ncbi:zinc finger protein 608-like isoform X2 [Saccostrea echinata]|uniref:zinc finger protein 608-like isoform X2 n=1 Tax=Saccostrea echinata TaxID=191078 RepID=UPI002A7FB2F0|nr:zinc finger protein 608-like isoform X2 [Saccostrea echinata]
MSSEHQATVDKGLRMKITKRTNKNTAAMKNESKNESPKNGDQKNSQNEKDGGSSGGAANGGMNKPNTAGEKSPKVKGVHKKDRGKETKGGKSGDGGTTGLASVSASLDNAFSQVSLEPKLGETADPYEFNAKVEDGISIPVKSKGKGDKEKGEANSDGVSDQCVGTDTCSVATETEPDCLGPCEPGTHVNLDGIVWQETENGVLVVNVTWRGKTYVGTLLDATKHDWAPPRPNCESPVSDFETRTPKGRGAKRGRGSSTGTPVNEKLMEGRKLRKGRRGSTFTAPPSPAKSDISTLSTSSGLKRKGRPTDIDLSGEKSKKRSRSCSRGNSGEVESPLSGLLECPEPSCNKKYRNPNGLRYHQSHAHTSAGSGVDMDDESRDMMDNEDSILDELESNLGDNNCDVNSSAINNDLNQLEIEEESNFSVKRSDEDFSRDGAAIKAESRETDSATVSQVSQVPIKPIKKDIISVAPHIHPTPSVAVATATPFHVVSTQQVSPSFGNTLSQSKSVSTGLVTPITATIVTATPIQTSLPLNDQLAKPPIRPKTGTGHPRPIMPSNFIALTTNAAHSNLTPVTTHVPSTTQLKPIQPKPTVMGETPLVNNVLLGLNKERKQKPKKKAKDSVSLPISCTSTLSSTTTSTSSSPFGSSHKKSLVKLDGGKHEPQGVIKVAPIVAKPIETKQEKIEPEPIRPLGANVGVIQAQVHPMKGIDLSSRCNESSPSVLKVTPSLHVPDSNKNMSDNVQSPAYSDISDANDGGSPDPPPVSESPQIRIEEQVPISKPKDLSTEGNSGYGMYGQYYPQSNYMLQNLSPSAHSPSNSQKPSGSGVTKDHPSDPIQSSSSDAPRKIKAEAKDEKRDGSETGKMEAVRPFSQSDYHLQQQKWMQMYYLQNLPHHQQYQYMPNYGPMVDPGYHMHMMQTDPMYRQNFEKMMDDPRRMAEYMTSADYKPKSDDGGPRSSSAGPSSSEGHKAVGDSREDNADDRLGRDKQNENHQIMRENHDLKTQMDRIRGEQPSGSDRDRSHSRLTEEQQRRQYMFQQQKHIEQQKREEQRRSEVKSEKMDSKRDETSKRESDSKSKLDSSRGFDDKNRGQSAIDKSRVTDTPKSKVGILSKDSGPHTPSSSLPSSVAQSPSAGYSPYNMYHSQFMQSQPYGHVQFDPSHPMYQRGINPSIMYPAGGYIHHPSQLGYRLGEDTLEKDPVKPPKVPIETDIKVPSETAHNALYHSGSSHKIHELQEKSRRSPLRASPGLGKTDSAVPGPSGSLSGSVDKGREFSKSPPTQRHVHTHHHTHVVEAAYPMYPYSAGILPGSQSSSPSSSLNHAPYPPSK